MTLGAVLHAEVIAEIDTLVGTDAIDDWDVEAIETAARRQTMWVAARAVEQPINADTSDHAGPTVPCGCGQPARYAGRRDKTVASVLGLLTLSRAYDHCAVCETGLCPRDRALGVQRGSLMPGALRMVGRVGAMVSYWAAIESAATCDTDEHPAECVQRLVREATRRGVEQAGRRVVLGDGALWIWSLTNEHFPGAIPIVDLFHATEHLWDVAKAIYGAGSDLAAQWAKTRRDELDAGTIDDLLAALRLHVDANDEARKCFDYVTRHRHRMRYPAFRAQGLCVGSGVVEAGCKTAIGVRCKRAGMHWTVAGADAIIVLRCGTLSGRFEDFWEYRSAAGTGAAG